MLHKGEYTLDIVGTQIFPNEQLRYSILTQHHQSVYNISGLTFAIMAYIMKTHKSAITQLHVQPAIIDYTRIRLNIDIHAATADVSGQWLARSYNNLEIISLRHIRLK